MPIRSFAIGCDELEAVVATHKQPIAVRTQSKMNKPEVIELNNRIHDRVVEFLRSETKGPLLDVGAGDGTLSDRLCGEGFSVKAVDLFTNDFKPKDIEIVSANLNRGIPFRDNEFSVVVATEVIEHIENPWFFVRELYRVIKPGGVAVISTPNLANLFVRGWFALSGQLYNFMESSYRDIGHITPVYLWNLRRMVENKFTVEIVSVNASPVPKTRFCLPTKSLLFGQCVVVKLRRLAGPPISEERFWSDSRVIRETKNKCS